MPRGISTKYIFVSGGVISGIGKGVTTASIALLLKSQGYKIVPIKFENYLNVDAGTINPIEHGDPFLCEDGTETDMDVGSYEKFLDENMGKINFVTMGEIYKTVIERERAFEYKGEDVEAIPHITDEIIARINLAVKKTKSKIVIIELGGTAGEYQNILYYEASRILALKNPGDVIHVHVSYVPTPTHLGEPKTKPTQLSVRSLNSMGIQPDFIIARSDRFLDERRRARFALFCNIHEGDIISSPDVRSVYEIPLQLKKQDFDKKLVKKLGLPYRQPSLAQWKKLVDKIYAKKIKTINIAIVGKYFGTGDYQLRDSYAALFDALSHAALFNNANLQTKWIDAENVDPSTSSGQGKLEASLRDVDGVIVPIGWGGRGAEGMITAAGYARDKKIPYLGLCYGMQLACISFARDILKLKAANTTENNKRSPHPIIHLMPSQKKVMESKRYGGTMRLGGWQALVKKGTQTFQIYENHDGFLNKRRLLTSERHRHRYEFNNKYASLFERNGMIISARSVKENLAEIIEMPNHPFYIGTQGHPEYKSRPLKPHPIFVEFLKACLPAGRPAL